MSYEIDYKPAALKKLNQLPSDASRRILDRIESLKVNPRLHGCKKLSDKDDYRIRIGDYRVIYTIYDDRLIVLVIDVGHRRDIYR